MTEAPGPEETPVFSFHRQARSPVTAFMVAAVLLALGAAWVWLEAAGWLMLLLGGFTLPAMYDLIANPAAGTTLTRDQLHWHSGRHSAQVARTQVDHMRLDTRLDFSVRASVVLRDGRKLRLPFEATPPHRAFEEALQEAGIPVKRTHFHLMQ